MNIYVHKDGTQYGPYTLEQVKAYLQQGSFTLQDQACHDGQNWVPLVEVPGVNQTAATPQSSAQPTTQNAITATARTTQTTPPSGQTTGQGKTANKSGGSKKWLLFGGIGLVTIAIITGVCIWIFTGDDKTDKKDELVTGEEKATEKDSSAQNAGGQDDPSVGSSSSSSPMTPIIERIPSASEIVIFLRVDDLLDKGRNDIAALLPPGLPPMAGKALEDPTSLGLDVSEPLQIHLIPHENINLAPTGGIAGKLSDKEKFMNTIELIAGLDKPVQKDGFLLYAPLGNSEPQIAIGSDFFFAGFADKPSDREPSITDFMTTDGSESLLNTNESFAQFSNEKHDLSFWFYGDKFFQALDANLQANLKDTGLSMMEGGTGYLTLNFESGEMVMDMGFTAPNDEMVYGKGKFSEQILSLAPADTILSIGFAIDLFKIIAFVEKEILPGLSAEFGIGKVNLDEPIDELGGLTVRDAISSFTGEFLLSLTDVKMPAPGAGGGFPGGPTTDGIPGASPFGGPTPPGAGDPFSDPEMAEGNIPFPGPGGTGGFPGGGPPPGGMMMGAMPKPEFIVAASIDKDKWLKLKAAPPLAMGLGLAMMQGISITEKNDFLLIASKDHLEATQSGSVKNPVSGSAREIFEKNDFVMRINVAPILKMDLPIPQTETIQLLKKISHFEMSSNNGMPEGTATLKLAFTDKNKNSLSQIIKMAEAVVMMMKPMGVVDEFEGMDEEFEFE